MSDAKFQLSIMKPEHDRSGFSCGIPVLDRYFQQHAGQDVRRRVAAVYVLYDKEHQRVAGYFTLSASSIEFAELPAEDARKLPRYPKLPACLIGRLAVDNQYQRQGLGRMLLFDGIRRAWELTEQLGVTAVIVDAIDDRAETFYQQFGFRSLGDPADRRLFLLLKDTRKILGL